MLYFYPKDFSSGCTAEACNLRGNYDSLAKAGYTNLGVSTDDQLSHKDFKTKYNLPLLLLLMSIHQSTNNMAFGLKRKEMVRSFEERREQHLSKNEKGVVVDKINLVDTSQHAQQVLSYKPGQ